MLFFFGAFSSGDFAGDLAETIAWAFVGDLTKVAGEVLWIGVTFGALGDYGSCLSKDENTFSSVRTLANTLFAEATI